MRLTLATVIDRSNVPDLTEPTSLAVDSAGNLMICDRPNGIATISRLVAADGYRREVLGRANTLDLSPLLVQVGPRDTVFVCGETELGTGRMAVKRLAQERILPQNYALSGPPSDLTVDQAGKLWVIYREGAMNPTIHAFDGMGRVVFDYDQAVEEAQDAEQIAPPAFMDGQYITVSPSGKIWFGGFLERASCVRLDADGNWEFWDYPTDFAGAHSLIDYYGLAALSDATLVTTDFRSLDGRPERQYVVELDVPRQRAIWHDLAEAGVPDTVAPAEPSIWDICYVHTSRQLYLCDYTYHRVLVLDVS